METGFDDVRQMWRERGRARKWLAGALVGWWFGVLVGMGVALRFDVEQNWMIVFMGWLLVSVFINMASSLIAGRPQITPPSQQPP